MPHSAGPHGVRAYLFVNNPWTGQYSDPVRVSPGYDVLTDPTPTGYSVPVNAKTIDVGDVGVVYRVREKAHLRDPGDIVGVCRITSSPHFSQRDGYGPCVSWELRLLPPEKWIPSSAMKRSGLWVGKVPFSSNKQISQPVELDARRWAWTFARLPSAMREWLVLFAHGAVSS